MSLVLSIDTAADIVAVVQRSEFPSLKRFICMLAFCLRRSLGSFVVHYHSAKQARALNILILHPHWVLIAIRQFRGFTQLRNAVYVPHLHTIRVSMDTTRTDIGPKVKSF
jgi:hypothetical protein